MTFDQDLRTMLRDRAEDVEAAPVVPDGTVRRVGVRKTMAAGGALAVVAIIALTSAFALSSSGETDAAPVPPAKETPREQELRNGRIITSGEGSGWQKNVAPPKPGASPYFIWSAFDQDTGSFLFTEQTGSEVWVVGEDGPIAEFICPLKAICGRIDRFGPGPDEVTVPARDADAVRVIRFDGTVSDTLDISAVIADDGQGRRGEELFDLAWSPDGDRLAVSTEPEYGCDPRGGPCKSKVWIFHRDGDEPQLVYAERTLDKLVEGKYQNQPTLRDLAWSPDGRTLTFVVASQFLEPAANTGVRPRLVALRFQMGQTLSEDTLHSYDDYDWNEGMMVPNDYRLHFSYAWSPDGTRIAVNSEGGIAEISAEDGRVLARHPGEDVHGPLAWMPER